MVNPVKADEGETIAGALLRRYPLFTRTTPVMSKERASFCMIGTYFEYLALVNSTASVQTGLTIIQEGICVERQSGGREVCANANALDVFLDDKPNWLISNWRLLWTRRDRRDGANVSTTVVTFSCCLPRATFISGSYAACQISRKPSSCRHLACLGSEQCMWPIANRRELMVLSS